MPSVYGMCDVNVPNPVCDPCLSDTELGGVRGVAFIHKDAIDAIKANPSSNVQWALLKDQGLIFIIPETRGTFNGGDVITRTGFGNRATMNVGFNFTLEYDDPSYKSNCAFYNQIMQSGMYHLAFMSETQLKVSDSPVEVIPTAPLTDNTEDQAVWHIIVNWKDKLQPCPADAPNDVFVCESDDELPETQINPTLAGIYGNEQTNTFEGLDARVSTFSGGKAGIIIAPFVSNLDQNGFPYSQGGEVAFLVSEPFDAPLPAGNKLSLSDFKLAFSVTYSGSQYSSLSPVFDAGARYSLTEHLTAQNPVVKECDTAYDLLSEILQLYPVSYLQPGKTYYFAVYAKANKMKGTKGSFYIELTLPTLKSIDTENLCIGAQWGVGFISPVTIYWTDNP